MTIDIYKQAFYSPSSFFSSFFAPTEIYVVAKEDIEKAKHDQYHQQLKAINERITYLQEQKVEVQSKIDAYHKEKEAICDV
tara:strand:- start:308 stop:550 length:243 start_codon:yes stop_codon:yes gene_type:complete